jgi:hypothetical protein
VGIFLLIRFIAGMIEGADCAPGAFGLSRFGSAASDKLRNSAAEASRVS